MTSELFVLNSAAPSAESVGLYADGSSHSVVRLSSQLRKLLNRIKAEYGTEDGSSFDYTTLKSSSLYSEYVRWTANLYLINMAVLNEGQRKAFLINIYNSLTVHGILAQEVLPKSVIDVSSFWRSTAYRIGEHVFSLDDIEHGLLRGNRPHPSTGCVQLSSDDPRLSFVIANFDCRIHFALNCGAESCPAVSIYSEDNINEALEAAACSYCDQMTTFVPNERAVVTSRLFLWYARDFGDTDTEVIRWIIDHVNEDKKKTISNAAPLAGNPSGLKLMYSDYQWRLNNC